MEKHDSKPLSLFFHMGPGFHANVEASAFSKSYPHVTFLNQPLGIGFSDLVVWTKSEIQKHSSQTGEPLCLLGHSFGSQLIAAALPEVSNYVSEVRLLNSTFDSFDSFANIQSEFLPDAQGCAFWKTQPIEKKLEMIVQLASDSRFAGIYWQNQTARNYYEKLAASFPALEINSFLKVYSEYLSLPALKYKWDGRVKIFYSLKDPLVRDFSCVETWNTIFPRAQFHRFAEGGHNLHFESTEVEKTFFGP